VAFFACPAAAFHAIRIEVTRRLLVRFYFRTAAALAFSLMAIASTASATRPHVRNGFYIGFGLGAGHATWDWAVPDTDSPSEGSGVGNFRIGGAVRDDVTIGLESSAWVKDYDLEVGGATVGNARASFSAVTFAATWFPGNRGAYLRGGVGFATARGEVHFDELAFVGLEATDKGAAILAAGGYEWRLSDKFAVGPQVEFVYLGIDGDVVHNVSIIDGSAQFTWYW
jgi:hypothetical protein